MVDVNMRAVIISYDIPDVNKTYKSADETLIVGRDAANMGKLMFAIRNKISKSLQETGRASVMVDIR